MSQHMAFRRQPVTGQVAQNLKTSTIAAPTNGLALHENQAFMSPGTAIVQDNWATTLRGVKLRGGFIRWCDLHAATAGVPQWGNAHVYGSFGEKVYDVNSNTYWTVAVLHTSAASGTFGQDRTNNPTYWTATLKPDVLLWQNQEYGSLGERRRDVADNTYWDVAVTHAGSTDPAVTFADWRAANPTYWEAVPVDPRTPVISAFEYVSGNVEKMFAAQADRLFDVTASSPIVVKSGQNSGNYSTAQMSNAQGDWLIAVNDAGDNVLRFNGTTWASLAPPAVPSDGAAAITGPVGTPVEFGMGLTYVWKYRNRLFFVQGGSMNAWYLNIDSVGGALLKIPLSGSASLGGSLIAGFSWSLDAGDGLSEKNCFLTDEGEVLIFEGTDPSNAAAWRQQGRYYVSPPMGMNAHTRVGGDIVIATIDGLVPLSQAIQRNRGQLELAMLSRAIKPLWREEVNAKRDKPWTLKKWDEYGGMFVALPGGNPGERFCLVTNNTSNAWCRFSWPATCFIRLREDMFFGTDKGIIMLADRTGYDDGAPYVCTLVGGWELFRSGGAHTVWHQARAVFTAANRELFNPQIDATVNYVITIPPPPTAGEDLGRLDVWDQGLWDQALWDQGSTERPVQRNTMWVSVGKFGFSHAPIVQVQVAQQAKPDVELLAIATTFEPAGVNI